MVKVFIGGDSVIGGHGPGVEHSLLIIRGRRLAKKLAERGIPVLSLLPDGPLPEHPTVHPAVGSLERVVAMLGHNDADESNSIQLSAYDPAMERGAVLVVRETDITSTPTSESPPSSRA